MRKIKVAAMLATIFFLGNTLMAQAGKTGAISGYVKDSHNKNVLIEAVVTITSNAFTGSKFALTDSTGIYSVKNLPAGTYTVSFEMEGYKKFTQENIVLKEGQMIGVSFQMAREAKKRLRKNR